MRLLFLVFVVVSIACTKEKPNECGNCPGATHCSKMPDYAGKHFCTTSCQTDSDCQKGWTCWTDVGECNKPVQ